MKTLKDFDIKWISLIPYNVKSRKFVDATLDNKHIMELENADILILQVIEKERGFLNNIEVIKFCKSDCKVIKIPHYRINISPAIIYDVKITDDERTDIC